MATRQSSSLMFYFVEQAAMDAGPEAFDDRSRSRCFQGDRQLQRNKKVGRCEDGNVIDMMMLNQRLVVIYT